ncbi:MULTISPECIES: class I SAM-dependent methyltransferase [Cyanobium]|uniref:Methyltransferase n=1 Tax=Cyanobium usitatum str. Tous TaxID=2116684 RepID=A0A2P7MVC0_9CYAN|nr:MULTISPECIES: class I SAM-dependent methyltransferase [Cyanobium]MCP9780691.1 class I SAM-dependent methyltransferase [Cyanobium sp. To12R1]PSJ05125.1 methyltransferase [Cyanobium usitatum str. Tous]
MNSYKAIDQCRISGSEHLVSVLNLGHQALTGVFPRRANENVTNGPLELVWCPDSGLLQLRHSYEPSEMYGDNYGYRSGLNQSMVSHLTEKVAYLERLVQPKADDVILDIGSNDCTTLRAYQTAGLRRIGIDPTGRKFKEYYPPDVRLVPDFFSEAAYRSIETDQARIVTSIAMFYDLDAPIEFARQIESILADDGVWHFEQSYMPSMLRMNSYDTICHEHLEYYSLGAVKRILEAAGLRLVDVVMNAVNGGSFAVTAAKAANKTVRTNQAVVDWLLVQEDRMGLNTPKPFRDFEERVFRHRDDLTRLIRTLNADGKRVLGYGASTKGNVVLQFCGLTREDIPAIAEVNIEKFGRVTPGSHIPIVSEEDARAMRPDYFLVLPWHFKEGILRREKEYLASGGRFIIPFPEIEII